MFLEIGQCGNQLGKLLLPHNRLTIDMEPSLNPEIIDAGGCGNNYSVGYTMYDEHLDSVRMEINNRLNGDYIFLLHSTAGGTGSGFGSRVLELIRDEYADCLVYSIPVIGYDVITSPYNTLLSLSKMCEHSDMILAVDNEIVRDEDITRMINTLITSSIDINELSNNLVCFRDTKIVSSFINSKQLFTPVTTTLSAAHLTRGYSHQESVVRLKKYALDEYCKIHTEPRGEKNKLLLVNTTSTADYLSTLLGKYNKLFKRKAHLHHYLDNIELDDFRHAEEVIKRVAGEYRKWD